MKTTFNDFIGESSSTKEVVLQNKMNRNTIITIIVDGGRISEIKNPTKHRFPYEVGQFYNRGIETWASNNNFLFNGKDLNKENSKIFGIKTKDIPQGHEFRYIFPNKFK